MNNKVNRLHNQLISVLLFTLFDVQFDIINLKKKYLSKLHIFTLLVNLGLKLEFKSIGAMQNGINCSRSGTELQGLDPSRSATLPGSNLIIVINALILKV